MDQHRVHKVTIAMYNSVATLTKIIKTLLPLILIVLCIAGLTFIVEPQQVHAQNLQFSQNSIQDPALGGLLNDVDSGQDDVTLTNMERVISRIIGGLTIIGGIAFVIYFMLASFTWVTAGGDAGKIQKARDQMVQGVLGLIIIIIAYSVVSAIGTVIGINILNPSKQVQEIFSLQPTNP